jgi:phospholipid-transporting ATPase
LAASLFNSIWTLQDSYTFIYLEISNATFVYTFFVDFGTWFIAFMNFVPISMMVTLEMVKFIQAWFITCDYMIYDCEKDLPTLVQSSNLNEELGMVHYVFSDKTGTLTQNIMEFKKFVAGKNSYGISNPKVECCCNGITNVNFEDARLE